MATGTIWSVLVAPILLAQGGPQAPAIRTPQDITFDLIKAGQEARTYEVDQVRRFRMENGDIVGVRERLLHTSNNGGTEDFRLDFLGLDSSTSRLTSSQVWRDTYTRQSGLIQQHGSFRVVDPQTARQNYVIFWLGSTSRVNRLVERVVVLPRRMDRSIWLLDLDRQTGMTLYCAEFEPSARVVGELEVRQLRLGSEVTVPQSNWAWQPWMVKTEQPTFTDAKIALGNRGSQMLEPDVSRMPAGYSLRTIENVENPLNGSKSMVLTYSDGIDEFFVMQTQDSLDVFTGLPAVSQTTQSTGHRVAYYEDSSLSVFLFQQGQVRFLVAGRGALSNLRGSVEGLYRQALGR